VLALRWGARRFALARKTESALKEVPGRTAMSPALLELEVLKQDMMRDGRKQKLGKRLLLMM
jgi:hypothetical protein